jgi:lipopolysaccharide export system permease protein
VRILTRHLLARFLVYLFSILAVVLAAMLFITLLLDFDDVLDPERGFVWTLVKLALQIPAQSFRTVFPIAALAAALACFGLSARWMEITAMKAGGISPVRAAAPILVGALALSGFSLLFEESVSVQASRALSRHLSGDREDRVTLGRGSFWYHRGDNLYNVQESDPDRGTLGGLVIYERSPEGRLRRTLEADGAVVADGRRWTLEGVRVRSFDLEHPEAAPQLERVSELDYALGGQKDLRLIDASAASLSLRELRSYIQARKRQGADVDRFRTLEQQRITEPFTVLLFVLLAIPLGLSVEQGKSLAVPALQAVGLAALYLAARGLAATLGAHDVTGPVASPWIVLVAFLLLGAWRLARVPR